MPNKEFKVLAVGTDTEVFLRDSKTMKSIPVCGLLGGTKNEPLAVLAHFGKGYSVQEDNVMAEFNIPAATSGERFVNSMGIMRKYLQEHFAPKGLELDFSASQMFEPSQLANKQAQTFGCEPDFNAWKLEENEIDMDNPLLRRMRTAGGHIHISFTRGGERPEMNDVIAFVKAMDIQVGIPSIMLDEDSNRRKVYGKAGSFRPKEYAPGIYGVEYRTLSNFWAANSNYCRWIYSAVHQACDMLNAHGDNIEAVFEKQRPLLLSAIDDVNRIHAHQFWNAWGMSLPDGWDYYAFEQKYIHPKKKVVRSRTPVAAAGLGQLAAEWTEGWGANIPNLAIHDEMESGDAANEQQG